MPLPIVICDDSGFARRQVARTLPQGWDVAITFADNGRAAIEAIREGKGDLLFLDLTMPGMDGFDVLEYIRSHDLPTMAIVISGDIQPAARERALHLGAVAFIKKPVHVDSLLPVLQEFGLLELLDGSAVAPGEESAIDFPDWCREVTNVAMGRAADLLARALDTSVNLSIPQVEMGEWPEVREHISTAVGEGVFIVSQGFTGGGLAGETLLLCKESEVQKIPHQLRSTGTPGKGELETVMEVGNILVGAFLRAFAEQLDIQFSQGHPRVYLSEGSDNPLRSPKARRRGRLLAIGLRYTIGTAWAQCNQWLLFTEPSVDGLRSRMEILTGTA